MKKYFRAITIYSKVIINKLSITFLILGFLILFISCSSVPKSTFQNSYYSQDYEDKSFKNVSMDICYPFIDFENVPPYADSSHVSTMKDFYEAFIEYFPQGIKTFSSVTQTGWIFFEDRFTDEIIEYHTITKDGLDFYVFLADSLSHFQKQSNADFLIITHLASFSLTPPDSLNPKSKYTTFLDFEFSVWDRITSELVTMDKVTSKIEFDQLAGKWPLRGVILKSAYEIFQRLPMFSK